MKNFTYEIIIEREPEFGSYYARCSSLPCYSLGYTAEEATARMAAAIELHIATLLQNKEVIPDAGVPGERVKIEQLTFSIPACGAQ